MTGLGLAALAEKPVAQGDTWSRDAAGGDARGRVGEDDHEISL